MGSKICSCCGVERDISRFSTFDNGYGPRFRNTCKDCKNAGFRGKRSEQSKRYYEKYRESILLQSKDYYLDNKERIKKYSRDWYKTNQSAQSIKRRAKAYGVSEAEILEILARGCEVCGSDGTEVKKGLHIDHCHSTKKVRGCLCHFCNITLGNLKDDKILILKLGEYLDKYQ